ncbi:MAG TPA: excinuclease ABC subunit UvrA, partial [Steroidobacteraceae bacterium]|nr:excinuclease ABC subunit UvrA [Steroidobacteraceae bacterium]
MPPFDPPRSDAIRIRGARQNNLKNLDLDLPLNELIVVTGVSGSGKSSLVFDTLYAEGQRRYVETFSPYARQFLDRMDKPQVDRIERIPPAIAIDQVNPVRTSRSTVGTMTEINDHLKLLYARLAQLHCRGCGRAVRRDDAQSICAELAHALADLGQPLLQICFPVPVPPNLSVSELKAELAKLGYVRVHCEEASLLTMVQDRLRLPAGGEDRSRLVEALEAALKSGHGRLSVHVLDAAGGEMRTLRFSGDLHCAECDLHYQEATQGLFSFNSPIGACDTCRGFGRVIGIDYGLVVPDEGKSLRAGAIRPWQTPAYQECQDDLLRFAARRGVPADVPWSELSAEQRRWVIEGEGSWEKKVWYGVRRFFNWLESRAYKMHIRVLLSKYRSYTICESCSGARLKPDALLWRLGTNAGPEGAERPRAEGHSGERASLAIHEVVQLPIEACRRFFDTLQLGAAMDQAGALLLGELRTRLRYLCDVGLGYLTLDRQSRTLSGGEVQRINLTTALGTSLVNTLFVLDEPSIGLHPRDMQRVIGVMRRLRDAGNTLLVVEHDPQIMLEADRIIDLGPGAGEHGGRIVCAGTPSEVMAHPQSATGAWLSGRRRLPAPTRRAAPQVAMGRAARADEAIRLYGAAEHNLRDLDVEIPLHRLVCLTGVSGSGKSTLVQDVLHPALLKAHGRPTEAPGKHRALEGAELIEAAVLIDQSPIGRTTRSNPASYVGAFDEIRARFAAEPEARLRRYTAGTFSFNSGKGRCPTCGGNGFEHIEMQFLSDVYLRCADCQGRRYRPETLQIRLTGADGRRANIAEVLELTVTEALAFFADAPAVLQRLKPLSDVGLDYVRLGQPVPTLSGGEAQRLKLAGHLAAVDQPSGRRRAAAATAARSTDRRGKLLIFDEPTTGLHFEDIARLVRAFELLLSAGHSLLVIEHNLDVIRTADWIIDLGPEGGIHGGQLIAATTPEALMQLPHSHTGRALRDYTNATAMPAAVARATGIAEPRIPEPRVVREAPDAVAVRGAREHNLKNIDIDIPHNRFSVITGVSGSGKSTLAFDILFNEGQRRYLESLN